MFFELKSFNPMKILVICLASLSMIAFSTATLSAQPRKKPKTIPAAQPKPNPLDAKLIAAVKAKNVEEVKKLLAQGADPNAIDYDLGFRIPVLNVILNQSDNPNAEREIAMVLVNAGADVNGYGSTFYPPLLLAGDVEVVRLLIKKGADVNYSSPRSGLWTPLHQAVLNYETIPWLIAAGAKLNEVNDEGNTPLMLAISRIPTTEGEEIDGEKAKEIDKLLKNIQLLLEAGADLKIKNNEGQTALMMARELKLAKVIELLQKPNANQPKQ
jgi:ankyrin repeat protein